MIFSTSGVVAGMAAAPLGYFCCHKQIVHPSPCAGGVENMKWRRWPPRWGRRLCGLMGCVYQLTFRRRRSGHYQVRCWVLGRTVEAMIAGRSARRRCWCLRLVRRATGLRCGRRGRTAVRLVLPSRHCFPSGFRPHRALRLSARRMCGASCNS